MSAYLIISPINNIETITHLLYHEFYHKPGSIAIEKAAKQKIVPFGGCADQA